MHPFSDYDGQSQRLYTYKIRPTTVGVASSRWVPDKSLDDDLHPEISDNGSCQGGKAKWYLVYGSSDQELLFPARQHIDHGLSSPQNHSYFYDSWI